MLYLLSQWIVEASKNHPLGQWLGWLDGVRYITVRSGAAVLTAFFVVLLIGPWFIEKVLKKYALEDYAALHFLNEGEKKEKNPNDPKPDPRHNARPTMGGLLILVGIYIAVVLWIRMNVLVIATMLVLFWSTLVGGWDDYRKINSKSREGGLSPQTKLIFQFFSFGLVIFLLWLIPDTRKLVSEFVVPLYPKPILASVPLFAGTVYLILMVAFSNAVNLTDGVDGLAISLTVIFTGVLLVATYVAGHYYLAQYLKIPYVAGAGELTVFCAAIIGAALGFLWYNSPPGDVIMGDTGSLGLGGALAIIAFLIHQPFLLVIGGGMFFIELGSSLLQTGYYKYTRWRTGVPKRIFRCAPLHHHYQKNNIPDTKIVARFCIVGALFALLALATLKIR